MLGEYPCLNQLEANSTSQHNFSDTKHLAANSHCTLQTSFSAFASFHFNSDHSKHLHGSFTSGTDGTPISPGIRGCTTGLSTESSQRGTLSRLQVRLGIVAKGWSSLCSLAHTDTTPSEQAQGYTQFIRSRGFPSLKLEDLRGPVTFPDRVFTTLRRHQAVVIVAVARQISMALDASSVHSESDGSVEIVAIGNCCYCCCWEPQNSLQARAVKNAAALKVAVELELLLLELLRFGGYRHARLHRERQTIRGFAAHFTTRHTSFVQFDLTG